MIRTGLIISLSFIALMAAMVFYTVQNLPVQDLYPVHWGIDGTPDRWVPREEAIRNLWLLPGIALFISLLMAVLPFIDPRKNNIFRSKQFYLSAWIATMALLSFVTGGISAAMLGLGGESFMEGQFVRLIIGAVSLLIIIIGNFLPKAKPSFFMGIRTPWTLSSNDVWEKTHRLGGRLFMLSGFIGLVSAFVANNIWLALPLPVSNIAAVLISVLYSWKIYDQAPDKIGLTDYED